MLRAEITTRRSMMILGQVRARGDVGGFSIITASVLFLITLLALREPPCNVIPVFQINLDQI
jgi:hypothetical protein